MWMSRKPLTPYFYPRPLRGGRRGVLSFDGTKSEFLSTPSARRATPVRRGAWSRRGYFYPRPLRGGRPRYLVPPRASFSNFYPRPLRGGRLGVHAVSMFSPIFLSTPSARRATITCCSRSSRECISIHALCEEGDNPTATYESIAYNFYPRPLRGGRRIFPKRVYSNIRHFYPRPLRGGRREHFGVVSPDAISIHALREEGDICAFTFCASSSISIHALREEGDPAAVCPLLLVGNFYPRPPRGGRPMRSSAIPRSARFLSTPSARRATAASRFTAAVIRISIHALREEGDLHRVQIRFAHLDFYPRPPRGGRRKARLHHPF